MPTRRLLRLGNGDGAFPDVPMDASLLVVGVAVAWLIVVSVVGSSGTQAEV